MNLERLKIRLQAAGVALVAIGLLSAGSYEAIKLAVAAELAPVTGRVDTLEETSKRTADSLEALKKESVKQTEALEWIKGALQRLEAKAHSH